MRYKCNGNYQRLPLCTISISTNAISHDGSQWLHCIEATKTKVAPDKYVARLRVIINTNRGVNVSVPLDSEEMFIKFEDLRFSIRNSNWVSINFERIFVTASPSRFREICLTAYNFQYKEG